MVYCSAAVPEVYCSDTLRSEHVIIVTIISLTTFHWLTTSRESS